MWPRRGHLEIMANILEIVSHGGATKTSIVYKANLNFTIVQRYLDHLRSIDMIELSDGGGTSVYRLTTKGREALPAVRRTMELLLAEELLAS